MTHRNRFMEYLLKIVVFHSYVRGNEAANIGIQAARKYGGSHGFTSSHCDFRITIPIGSMYAIYGNIYHQYTPNGNMAYMDPMGLGFQSTKHVTLNPLSHVFKQEKTWQKWGEPMLR